MGGFSRNETNIENKMMLHTCPLINILGIFTPGDYTNKHTHTKAHKMDGEMKVTISENEKKRREYKFKQSEMKV